MSQKVNTKHELKKSSYFIELMETDLFYELMSNNIWITVINQWYLNRDFMVFNIVQRLGHQPYKNMQFAMQSRKEFNRKILQFFICSILITVKRKTSIDLMLAVEEHKIQNRD